MTQLTLFVAGAALMVGGGAMLGWSAARAVTRYMLGGRL